MLLIKDEPRTCTGVSLGVPENMRSPGGKPAEFSLLLSCLLGSKKVKAETQLWQEDATGVATVSNSSNPYLDGSKHAGNHLFF